MNFLGKVESDKYGRIPVHVKAKNYENLIQSWLIMHLFSVPKGGKYKQENRRKTYKVCLIGNTRVPNTFYTNKTREQSVSISFNSE